MTATLLSLLNISCGIIGAVAIGYWFKKYSLGITGNVIIGVFGSILMTKTFGRLGFDVSHIVNGTEINFLLLVILLVMSLLAGGMSLMLAKSVSSRFF